MQRLENTNPVLNKYLLNDELRKIEQIKRHRVENDTQDYEPID